VGGGLRWRCQRPARGVRRRCHGHEGILDQRQV
jgi:hypothetical protein